jgi:hypothetical protein
MKIKLLFILIFYIVNNWTINSIFVLVIYVKRNAVSNNVIFLNKF